MMDSDQIAIKATISPGLQILFVTEDDYLIFAAALGYQKFCEFYAVAYPDRDKPGVKDFQRYESQKHAKLFAIGQRTRLTNGQTLTEYMYSRLEQQGLNR